MSVRGGDELGPQERRHDAGVRRPVARKPPNSGIHSGPAGIFGKSSEKSEREIQSWKALEDLLVAAGNAKLFLRAACRKMRLLDEPDYLKLFAGGVYGSLYDVAVAAGEMSRPAQRKSL